MQGKQSADTRSDTRWDRKCTETIYGRTLAVRSHEVHDPVNISCVVPSVVLQYYVLSLEPCPCSGALKDALSLFPSKWVYSSVELPYRELSGSL